MFTNSPLIAKTSTAIQEINDCAMVVTDIDTIRQDVKLKPRESIHLLQGRLGLLTISPMRSEVLHLLQHWKLNGIFSNKSLKIHGQKSSCQSLQEHV